MFSKKTPPPEKKPYRLVRPIDIGKAVDTEGRRMVQIPGGFAMTTLQGIAICKENDSFEIKLPAQNATWIHNNLILISENFLLVGTYQGGDYLIDINARKPIYHWEEKPDTLNISASTTNHFTNQRNEIILVSYGKPELHFHTFDPSKETPFTHLFDRSNSKVSSLAASKNYPHRLCLASPGELELIELQDNNQIASHRKAFDLPSFLTLGEWHNRQDLTIVAHNQGYICHEKLHNYIAVLDEGGNTLASWAQYASSDEELLNITGIQPLSDGRTFIAHDYKNIYVWSRVDSTVESKSTSNLKMETFPLEHGVRNFLVDEVNTRLFIIPNDGPRAGYVRVLTQFEPIKQVRENALKIRDKIPLAEQLGNIVMDYVGQPTGYQRSDDKAKDVKAESPLSQMSQFSQTEKKIQKISHEEDVRRSLFILDTILNNPEFIKITQLKGKILIDQDNFSQLQKMIFIDSRERFVDIFKKIQPGKTAAQAEKKIELDDIVKLPVKDRLLALIFILVRASNDEKDHRNLSKKLLEWLPLLLVGVEPSKVNQCMKQIQQLAEMMPDMTLALNKRSERKI